MKTKNKLFISFFSSLIALTIVPLTIVGCSYRVVDQTVLTNFSHEVPKNTPYEVAYNLEYSFMMVNSDNVNASKVFGTGWLFDYQIDNSSDDITCYFGTNLHVADALRNPYDNPSYVPENLKNVTNFASGELLTTRFFYLGKYEVDPTKSLIATPVDITYYRIGSFDPKTPTKSSLPKTQFAATNFYSNNVTLYDSKRQNYYVDFAVLSMTFNKNDLIYQNWIANSINTLHALVGTNNTYYVNKLFPLEAINHTFLYSHKSYIAGYPYNKYATYFAYPYLNIIYGSGFWSINQPIDSKNENAEIKYEGQPYDISMQSSIANGFPTLMPGVYFPQLLDWKLEYHDVSYFQEGIGYVIHNSNLSGGSSGSLNINQNNQIMGIYFGTWTYKTSNGDEHEVPYGLSQALRTSNSIQASNSITSKVIMNGYDLISGNENTAKSYKSSLQNVKTWLFSQNVQI